MNKQDKGILKTLSYVSLIIIALLVVITNLLPRIGLNINGPIVNLLSTVKDLFVLAVIGITAFDFTHGKENWVRILYWVAVAIFVVGIIFIWIF